MNKAIEKIVVEHLFRALIFRPVLNIERFVRQIFDDQNRYKNTVTSMRNDENEIENLIKYCFPLFTFHILQVQTVLNLI